MTPTLPITDDSPVDRQTVELSENAESESEPLVVGAEPDDFDVEGYEIMLPTDTMMSLSEATSLGLIVWINSDDDSDEESSDNNAVITADSAETVTIPEESPTAATVEMDPEHIEKIKAVMKNVTLPSSHLPSWTAVVPEEEWEAVLLEKIDNLSTESNKDLSQCKEHPSSSMSKDDTNNVEEKIETTTEASGSKSNVEVQNKSQSDKQ